MDNIAKFLAERLTKVETDLLEAFVDNDLAVEDFKTLKDLRLIEAGPCATGYCLSPLGRKVHNQIKMRPAQPENLLKPVQPPK